MPRKGDCNCHCHETGLVYRALGDGKSWSSTYSRVPVGMQRIIIENYAFDIPPKLADYLFQVLACSDEPASVARIQMLIVDYTTHVPHNTVYTVQKTGGQGLKE